MTVIKSLKNAKILVAVVYYDFINIITKIKYIEMK